MRRIKHFALSTLHLALCTRRRFLADESGQGIIFAAATLLLLVGFVAFVFNFGRLLDRRTKTQIAADAAAYSGAMVEADAVSAIAYINSAMSQVYYNSLKYAVDMNESAAAAQLEYMLSPQYLQYLLNPQNPPPPPSGAAWTAYSQQVFPNASNGLQQAKLWMLQLSQLENAIAIDTPRLVEEEMFAVAGRAGGERMSVYPSFRMFRSPDQLIQFSIVFLGNGWTITNLTTGASLSITLNGNTWDMQWSSATSSREVQITQNNPANWTIQFFQPTGSLVQSVSIQNDPNLGWVVSGAGVNPNGGPPVPMQTITFTPVDPEGLGYNEGVQISQGGYSQILMRSPDGNISVWNGSSYVQMTSNSTSVGGVNVQVNVTNTINFTGGSAQIGNPTVLNIGGARIVLSNPPTISTGFGPVTISINGFNPNQFNVSAGGFPLTSNSNGRWNDHYNPSEETWYRNRLVLMGPNQWEYDWEQLGALLQYDPNGTITQHAFMGNGYSPNSNDGTWPAWASTANGATPWFNTIPNVAAPANLIWQPQPGDFTPPPNPNGLGIWHLNQALQGAGSGYPPPGAYYQTSPANSPLGCPACNGTGVLNGQICPVCHGWDNYGNSTTSNIRVSIAMLQNPQSVIYYPQNPLMNPAPQKFPDDFYLSAPMFVSTDPSGYPNAPSAGANLPLIATADFFKWGVNVGVWKHPYNGLWNTANGNAPDTLMMSNWNQATGTITNVTDPLSSVMFFPSSIEPAWGTVAIASARVGLPVGQWDPAPTDPSPYIQNGCRYGFTPEELELSPSARDAWCASLDNLYYAANVQANLFASKLQVDDYDLDMDILQGIPAAAIDETGLSYLWSSVLVQNQYSYVPSNGWMDRFNGQSDPRVMQALSNMQDRQGATFMSTNQTELNQVVQH